MKFSQYMQNLRKIPDKCHSYFLNFFFSLFMNYTCKVYFLEMLIDIRYIRLFPINLKFLHQDSTCER